MRVLVVGVTGLIGSGIFWLMIARPSIALG
jgi:uncharacterized protein YbjT (DUF2867 family)